MPMHESTKVRKLRARLAAANALITHYRSWLKGIAHAKPDEIVYDQFAYKRMVSMYRSAARKALQRGR